MSIWSNLFGSKPTKPTPQSDSGVKILKKGEGGTYQETKGDATDVAPLFEIAYSKHQKIMTAVRSNSLTASDERELLSAVDLFTKIIELHSSHGEPFGMRAGLYMVYAQIKNDKSYLDKATSDYKKALEIGGADTSNHEKWQNAMIQILMLKMTM